MSGEDDGEDCADIIILVGDRIPQNLLTEDEILLQYYDIASSKV